MIRPLEMTAFALGQRFIGTKEIPGTASNPLILAMLRLDSAWPSDDAVPWCSAWVNFVCWLLRLPRSKSLAARSWLTVGRAIDLDQAEPGFDIVVLTRGSGPQPGPDLISAPGHVGFFAGTEDESVLILGGNQSDAVTVQRFPLSRVLGTRRLHD